MPDSSARIVDALKKAGAEFSRVQTPFIDTDTLDGINDKVRQGLKAAGEKFSSIDTQAFASNAERVATQFNESIAGTSAGINGSGEVSFNPTTGRAQFEPGVSRSDPVKKVPNKEENETNSDTGTSNIPPEFLEDIKSKENPFKGFATMTYAASIYLMGPEQYGSMISTGIKSVQGLDLLVQSGGISNDEKGNHGARRSPFFNVDFFIDDIELNGLVSGTSVNSPHNMFDMSFTITEPNGLSFLERLHSAVQDHNKRKGINQSKINYAAQNYLMVVRFYGYDINGNQVSGKDSGLTEALSSTESVSEKFIPFQFTDIQFSISNDLVNYSCKAVCPQTSVPFGVAQATVTENIELSGQTVRSLLVGKNKAVDQEDDTNPNTSEENVTPEEAQEVDAPSLIETLNSVQKDLVTTQRYEVANEYLIEFESGSNIGEAKVASPVGFIDKERVSMSKTTKAQHDLLTERGAYNKDAKIYSITAGQPIVQVLDTIIRTSSYISDQQDIVIDEVTGKSNYKQSQKVFQWFKIRTEVKPLKYDNKRNDYAYRIKYVISRYLVNNTRSPYFPGTSEKTFRGVHKEYEYWFTGKNTEVLSFTQTYNYSYYQTFGSDIRTPLMQNNARELTKRYYQNSSSDKGIGGKNGRNEPSSNVASLLYSPADQASAILTIVGDPDWIAQSEIFYSPTNALKSVDQGGAGSGPFMQDGSVNYDSSEVLFSINYNTNIDYDLKTGLADPGTKNFGRNLGSGKGGVSRISLIYLANKITTNLSQGKFTQTLEGVMMLFPTQEQLDKEEQIKQNNIMDSMMSEAELDQDFMEAESQFDDLDIEFAERDENVARDD